MEIVLDVDLAEEKMFVDLGGQLELGWLVWKWREMCWMNRKRNKL